MAKSFVSKVRSLQPHVVLRFTLARVSSRVSTLVTTSTFWKRFVRLNVGLAVLELGVAVMLEAQVGLGPWPVFHEGVSLRLGLSFGRVMQLTGLLVIALGYLLGRVKPGLGTLLNMLLVGPWVDLFTARTWFPAADTLGWGLAQFLVGVGWWGWRAASTSPPGSGRGRGTAWCWGWPTGSS